MTDTNDILIAEGLEKSFGRGPARVRVLRGLDLAVRRGEFLAVMGPSGCGKSTLLHVLGMMAMPDAGRIVFAGRPVAARPAELNELRRRHIGFVFQRFNLLGELTAADNVAISLHVRGLKAGPQVAELFETLGITHVARRKPSQMSIGEQQRVAIARALAHRPELLLADEPTGNLDSANSQALLELFRQINRRDGQTIVMITHSADAAALADRVVHMKDGLILDAQR
jgi:putative ABC transport system ATP-binding protein